MVNKTFICSISLPLFEELLLFLCSLGISFLMQTIHPYSCIFLLSLSALSKELRKTPLAVQHCREEEEEKMHRS